MRSDEQEPHVTEALTARRAQVIKLRATGMSVRAVGEALGITHVAVVRHLQHPDARAAIQRIGAGILDELREDMRTRAPEMADQLAAIALGDVSADPHQVTAARAYLSFAGLAERQEIEVSGTTTVVTSAADLSDDAVEARLVELRAKRAERAR